MRVRCGRCHQVFEPSGPGDQPCPTCGAVNRIPAATTGSQMQTPQPPSPPVHHRRVTCDVCEHGFVVGDVAVVACPNCRSEVTIHEMGAADG